MLLACVIAGMARADRGSVPLYDLFCRVTGFGGTPRIDAQRRPAATGDAEVTVLFNADIGAGPALAVPAGAARA